MAGTVIFLGAGATKACKGLLTNEILHAILAAPDPSPSWALLSDFLEKLFHVNKQSPPDQFPGLPLVMSLLDTAMISQLLPAQLSALEMATVTGSMA